MPALPPAPLRDLPVAAVLDEIVAAARSGAVVVTAPPGSGKTMLVPAALLDHVAAPGRVVLLQPRRLAARAVAAQIARLRGTPLGGEVGYQVRFDARVGRETRLVVETTGIMLRRLLDDPAVEGVAAVVVDEFHERTIEMDLTLGLLLRAQGTVRPDLRIVVMSATLATGPVARLLGRDGAAPVVAASGRVHPVEIRHGRHGDRRDLVELVGEAVAEALRATDGHVLVFLPGVGEILRCEQALRSLADRHGHALLTLSGDLPPEVQDRALEELGRRKVILSTNVAETSLTIPGVTAVVDSGLARQMRIAATGLPRLERISISKASADQRAGRAGRTGPGVCWRLWDEAAHHQLPAAETPQILRGDLCGTLLHLLALGERGEFPWLDAPPPEAVEQARTLLVRLGAIESGPAGPADRITPLGLELVRLPAHPRLGRLLLAGAAHGVLREASLAAALLSERDPFRGAGRERTGPRDRRNVRTRSDVVDRVVALQAFHEGRPVDDADLELHPGGARAVLRTAEQLYRLVESPLAPRAADPGTALMRALVEAFPDRIARLRPGAGDRATMVGGRGVRLDGGSRVRHEPFVVVVDLDDAGGEARVRQASAVEYEWLTGGPQAAANMRVSDELLYHPARRQVEARRRTTWIDLALDEAPIPIADAAAAATILAREAAADLRQVLPQDDSPAGRLLARVRWLAATVPELALPRCDAADLAALLPQLCQGRRSLDEVQGADWLATLQALVGQGRLAEIDRLAPAEVELAGGKRHRLLYEPGKPPVLAARIQDLFGQRDTPRVAGGRIAVLLHLLGPNHRPQQITDDLAGFWSNTYPRVRTELRRRYPRHAWPDDPLARPGRADGKRGTT